MQTKTETLIIGKNDLTGQARFFYLLECQNPVDITFVMQRNGGTETAQGIKQGYWFEAPELISQIIVTSATAQDIKWAYTMGRGGYDLAPLLLGQANIIGNLAPVATVGAAAAELIVPAGLHKGVAFRNDDANTDRLAIGGPGVTFANAVHILAPGEVYTDDNAAAAAFYAIAETNAGQIVRVEVRS